MTRAATLLAGLAIVLAALSAPGAAHAAGCRELADLRQRADCVARERARSAARAEVERRTADPVVAPAGDGAAPHSPAWQQALEEAQGLDASQVLEPRPIAAVVGLAWFLAAVRRRWRRRSAAHA